MRYFLFRSSHRSKCDRPSKLLLFVCIMIVALSLFGFYIPTDADAEIYHNVIRFHVLANSDSEIDQDLKLKIRDAVIEEYADVLNSYQTKSEAEQALQDIKENIKQFVDEYIEKCGFAYTCDVELGEEFYERTEYKNYVMPSGNYTSLRILIGQGEGKNWWCVLFPPLCTQAAMNTVYTDDMESVFIEAGFTGEQYKIISDTAKPRYRVKFRLLELLFGDS